MNPIFEHLPVENMVYANQQEYYNAINRSSDLGDSGPFIDFMLEEILHALASDPILPPEKRKTLTGVSAED